jgi:hypothetical protein
LTNKHNILKLIYEFLLERGLLKEKTTNIREIDAFFNLLNATRERFNSAYLLNYLYRNISSDEVAKRKTTARDFEDYLAILFNGQINDEIKRENQNLDNIFIENEFITKFIISNRREKSDIKFRDGFNLSVKTVIKSNSEINLGSFEKTALFYLLYVEDFLNERKGREVELNGEKIKVGLGSKALLSNLFLFIKNGNNFHKFQTRFLQMVKYIFSDDMLIAVKDDKKMEIYFISSSKFYELFEDNIDDLLSIVNRWEGNSIRIDRKKVLEKASKVVLDFSFLENSFLKDFEAFENRLSELLVLYVNSQQKEEYKKDIFQQVENLLNSIDYKIEELS